MVRLEYAQAHTPTEEGSERVKWRKKTRSDAKGKGKGREQEAESEESEEEEKVSKRLGWIEKNIKEILKQQKEVIAQQDWLKRWVEMIWKDMDDMHLGMDGLYCEGESGESDELDELDELEENDWVAEVGELRAEDIEAMQNAEE